LNFHTLGTIDREVNDKLTKEGFVFPKIRKNQTMISMQGDRFLKTKQNSKFNFITSLNQYKMNKTLNISKITG
jgi:hypothetical protein